MRWATYERWVAKYDAAEEMLDAQLAMVAARLMKKFSSECSSSRLGEESLRAVQAFVNLSGAASSCASTARLFPLKPAVKGGPPSVKPNWRSFFDGRSVNEDGALWPSWPPPSATSRATVLRMSIECPSQDDSSLC
jgi:hypothetical protein